MNKRLCISSVLLFCMSSLFAQEDSLVFDPVQSDRSILSYEKQECVNSVPPASESLNSFLGGNNYLGYDFLFPKLKKDWVSDDPWVGINAQLKILRFGYATGNAHKTDSTGYRTGRGYICNVGVFYNHPIHILRNFFSIEPEIGLDFIIGRFRDNPETNPMAWGLGVTPGLGIKIGPAKVVAKYCASFAVNMFDKTNAWSGGMSYPVFSAFFETGWGLMNPKNIQSRGIITSSETFRKIESTTWDGQNLWVTYKQWTVYTDHTVKSSIYDIGPFWYISPKVSSSRVISRDNRNTLQYGMALGGKVGIVGGDVYFTTGSVGFGNSLNEAQMKMAFGEVKDHSGEIKGSTMGVTGGFELMGLLTKIYVHSHEDRSIYSAVRFVRVFFTGGYGKTSFNGSPQFNSATAQQEILSFNTNYPNEAQADRYIPGSVTSSTFTSLGARIEIGLVSAGFDKYFYKDAAFANGYAFTFQYMIPPSRLYRAAKVMNSIKKSKKK